MVRCRKSAWRKLGVMMEMEGRLWGIIKASKMYGAVFASVNHVFVRFIRAYARSNMRGPCFGASLNTKDLISIPLWGSTHRQRIGKCRRDSHQRGIFFSPIPIVPARHCQKKANDALYIHISRCLYTSGALA